MSRHPLLPLLMAASLLAPAGQAADTWRLSKDEDGVQVYLSQVPGSRYQSYRGVVDIQADVSTLSDLQENLRVACAWLYACAQMELLKVKGDETWVYMKTKLPWPAEPRDLVLHVVTERKDNGKLLRRIKAVPHYRPRVKGYIRVPYLSGLWIFEPTGERQTRVIYQMRAEPGGEVPAWLANRFVIDAPMETLRTLRAVAERQGIRAPKP
ncbi:START domain-containing protein [Pseudomonas sp. R5(2019)]|uniref:START domain-containing protein n=1 Tax=Pseudomonas sp. R5(2019) TaxID=2697566 RepID=UPI001413210E|nr:START domain-containing protein [Pseudomonas sp. R5(2019)]NBA96337.1 lipid-binding protein [Pseudomonas sp. R5(2019)]